MMTPDELRTVASYLEALDEWAGDGVLVDEPIRLWIGTCAVAVARRSDGQHFVTGVQ